MGSLGIILLILSLLVSLCSLVVTFFAVNLLNNFLKDEKGLLKSLKRHKKCTIRELDIKLITWLNIFFYLTIICGLIYIVIFHVFNIHPFSEGEHNHKFSDMTPASNTNRNQQVEAINKNDSAVNSQHILHKKNLTISNVINRMDNIQIGRGLFKGSIVLENGGPGCIMCHQVIDDSLSAGGLIAPELTNVYSRLDEETIIKYITFPYHLTMQEVYKGKQVTTEEAEMLVTFLKNASTESTHQQKRDQRAARFLNRLKKEMQ